MKAAKSVGLAFLVLAVVVVGAVSRPGQARADQGTANPQLSLMSQTPYVTEKGNFTLKLAVTGASPTDQLHVVVYDQLITRTSFDMAASGQVVDRYFYDPTVPVSGVPTDSTGAVDVTLPINQEGSAGAPFPMVPIQETGVFPVQVSVVSASGVTEGSPLTTFLTVALQSVSSGRPQSLAAAVIVPVATPPTFGPNNRLLPASGSEAARLNQLATVLDDDSAVPASVLASPVALDTLASGAAAGSTVDANAVASLGGAPQGGLIQVLPAPYSPLSLGDYRDAGLTGEGNRQMAAGATVLSKVFGVTPDDSTWVVDGPLDGSTLQALMAHHATRVIVPDSDLTSVATEYGLTLGRSAYLAYDGTQIEVVGADTTLTSDFTRNEPPVLAANVLLAEMAMIYTEAPSATRGVAVLPPPGWVATPVFVQTLLSGLYHNPVVSAVTASGLFSALPSPTLTRSLAVPQPLPTTSGAAVSAAAGTILAARTAINALQSVLPGQSAELAQLEVQLLIAEGSTLSPTRRFSILAQIITQAESFRKDVSLPPATSITLTSTRGQLPITIRASGNLHPTVELVLNSQRLIFHSFSPPKGKCQIPTPTKEVCTLSLLTQNTTLRVPVETRSSGVFTLTVELWTPGGQLLLDRENDRVQSTAVSSVAVILIIVALLMILVWWGRDLHRGRRPKGMAPAPTEEPPAATEFDGFFNRPPPEFGGRQPAGSSIQMSPSGAPPGPTSPTDRYGSGRETRE